MLGLEVSLEQAVPINLDGRHANGWGGNDCLPGCFCEVLERKKCKRKAPTQLEYVGWVNETQLDLGLACAVFVGLGFLFQVLHFSLFECG